MASKPINLWLMDIPKFIKENKCLPVTSVFIRESSSNEFKHDGLFSEDIFGQVNTPDRLIRMGYIKLRTKVLHPLIYRNLIKLKALYGEIMSRQTYAIFDPNSGEFVRSSEDDEDADTGYQFFMEHFYDLKFERNNSLTHNEMITVIENNIEKAVISECIVMPAGLRDLREDEAKPATDSINKIYASLINYTLALPTNGTTSDIYDNVRFSIQKKINELYEYIFDMVSGKFGFVQRRYGSRSLALGTRNVVSTANMAAKSPDDPQYLKMDEIKIPLFQACKQFEPLMVYNLKMLFFNDVFNVTADQVALIDPKTYNLVYQPIDEDEKTKFLTSEGVEKIISLFRDQEFRFSPVSVYNDKGDMFYLFMVYDDGEVIYLTRSVTELVNKVKTDLGYYDQSKVRPLTYAEMLYIACFRATLNKTSLITRYPAIETGSEVPNIVHLISTNPGRTVNLFSTKDDGMYLTLPEYPVINRSFVDSLVPHPQILGGLGMDFDGNCLTGDTTIEICFTKNWLEEIQRCDYTCSGQDIRLITYNLIASANSHDGLFFATTTLGEFPRPGIFQYDKNKAEVYTLPKGCSVKTITTSKPYNVCYKPITQITIERNCEVVDVVFEGTDKKITVSTNPSMAILIQDSLIKTAPTDADGKLNPIIIDNKVCFKKVKVNHLSYRKDTVYDLIVPSTKVFCVNDGVVVYDTASSNGVLSKQANGEIHQHLNSLTRYVHTNGNLMHGTTDLVKLTIYNLSRSPILQS